MEKERTGPADLPTSERMATIGGAALDAAGHKARGEHETEHGTRHSVPLAHAEAIVAGWPDAPQRGARQMGIAPALRQAAGKVKDVLTGSE